MTRIRRFFRHNLLWKLLALVSAFFIWLIVVNSSNPQITDTVTIPFDVLNEKALVSSSQIYTLSADSINVTYTVRQKFKNEVTPEAFSAYINLEDYSVTGAVPVYIEVDASVSDLITDIRINPSLIHVYTESIQQKKFAVKPYLIGEAADGYIVGEASVNPEYIYVKGPVSVMGRISSVGINIDVDGKNEDLEGTTPVVFLDANGNQLTGIEDTLSYAGDISYSIPIYRIKPLSVNAFAGGAPASGYTVDTVETSPTFISVYGPEEILSQYSYILIPGNAINVNGIKENKTFIIDATPYIPSGLKLAGTSPEITVYVKVRNIFETTPESTSAVHESESHTVPTYEAPTETASTAESVIETEHMTETSETGGIDGPESSASEQDIPPAVPEETPSQQEEKIPVEDTLPAVPD